MKEDQTNGIVLLVLVLVGTLTIGGYFWEVNHNTSEDKMFLVDKNWDIKVSEYWTEHYTQLVKKETCTGTGSNQKCSFYYVTESKSRDHWIKDCRTTGGIKDPIIYPICPQSRSDSHFNTTTYFVLLFGKDTERLTLNTDQATFERIQLEDVCVVGVYNGLFGKWLRHAGECR